MATITVSVLKTKHPRYKFSVVMSRDGRRLRQRYFKSKGEADAAAQAFKTEVGNTGAKAAASITDTDKRNIMDWRERLAPYGKTPADAVEHYLAHLKRCKVSITIDELSDKFQTHKAREKLSRRYLDDLRHRLGRFCADMGGRVVAEMTSEEISTWLAGLNTAPVTVANYRRILGVLFSYAVSLRATDHNPVTAAMKPKIVNTDVGILKVAEARALLLATSNLPEILPAIVIGLFGGVRDAEIRRLDWRNVNIDTGFVEIKAGTAKKASRRLVEIRPALRAWLEPHRKLSGPVWPAGERGRKLHEQARCDAGLHSWPHNALRHSFASYALAKWQNANALALEMGNSPEIIMEHYREVVTPAEAEAYFALMPAAAPENIITMPQAKRVA